MKRKVDVTLVLSERAARELEESGAEASEFIGMAVEEAIRHHDELRPTSGRKMAWVAGVAMNAALFGGGATWVARNEERQHREGLASRAVLVQQVSELKDQIALQRTVMQQQHAIVETVQEQKHELEKKAAVASAKP
jgi:phage shock protein A